MNVVRLRGPGDACDVVVQIRPGVVLRGQNVQVLVEMVFVSVGTYVVGKGVWGR